MQDEIDKLINAIDYLNWRIEENCPKREQAIELREISLIKILELNKKLEKGIDYVALNQEINKLEREMNET